MSRTPFVELRAVAGSALILLAACGAQPAPHDAKSTPTIVATDAPRASSPGVTSLKVALYPYVPRLQQFKDVISAQWQTVQPSVALQWADEWDGGYDMDPDPSYDVFVFDAINLGYFQSKNLLMPIQIGQVPGYADLAPFAQAGVTVSGNVLGIPQLGCGDFIFYNSADAAIASATNAAELASALGSCSYYGEKPSTANAGLMLDLAGGTTVSSTYIEGVYELSGQFPSPLPTQINPAVASTIQSIVGLASFNDILYQNPDNGYQRAAWYSQGFGRAYVGFTESMSQIDPNKLNSTSFKPMPWSTNSQGAKSPLFYSDVAGVGPATASRQTTALAIQLANLMTSASVIVELFGPYQGSGPQYLMPVSTSALTALATRYPGYAKMSQVLQTLQPILFNLGTNSKPWLAQMKSSMKQMVLANPKCYCDFPSAPIQDNNDAQTKCPAACGARGWSGQWTNISGPSVCGCNGACQTKAGPKGPPPPKH